MRYGELKQAHPEAVQTVLSRAAALLARESHAAMLTAATTLSDGGGAWR